MGKDNSSTTIENLTDREGVGEKEGGPHKNSSVEYNGMP